TSNTTEGGQPFFVGSAVAPVNIDQGTADIDVDLAPRDRLHGYAAIQEDLRQEPTLQGNTLPGWGDTRKSRRQIGTISEDHIFGPAVTNSLRVGYNRIHIVFTPNQMLNSANFGNNNFALDTTIFRFSSVTNFLSDTASSFTFAGTPANRILSPAYDGFAQDSFRVKSNVTLQLGFRYSWYATPWEYHNHFTVFDVATGSFIQVGTGGIGQPFHTNNKNS